MQLGVVRGEERLHWVRFDAGERSDLPWDRTTTMIQVELVAGPLAASFAAAAVALDANKQVVYARDATGAVVGRQLVAISEANELVCFGVYGAARDALAPAFRAFDAALAAKLGLAIAGDDYDVATILAHRWYDDGAWV